jgi:hypothetical protein
LWDRICFLSHAIANFAGSAYPQAVLTAMAAHDALTHAFAVSSQLGGFMSSYEAHRDDFLLCKGPQYRLRTHAPHNILCGSSRYMSHPLD